MTTEVATALAEVIIVSDPEEAIVTLPVVLRLTLHTLPILAVEAGGRVTVFPVTVTYTVPYVSSRDTLLVTLVELDCLWYSTKRVFK